MILEDQVDLGKMNYRSRRGSDVESHVFKGCFSQFSGGLWYSQDGLRAWRNRPIVSPNPAHAKMAQFRATPPVGASPAEHQALWSFISRMPFL